eukprot:300773_1
MKFATLFKTLQISDIKNSKNMLTQRCNSWKKEYCQKDLKLNRNTYLSMEILQKSMDHDSNFTVQSPWNVIINQPLQHVSVESADFSRPSLKLVFDESKNDKPYEKNNNFFSKLSIYDAICWNKAENKHLASTNIESYIKSYVKLSESMRNTNDINTMIECMKEYEHKCHG